MAADRNIKAGDIAHDIRSRMTDAELMEKYKLTARGLQSLFRKVVAAGVLSPEEVFNRIPTYEDSIEIEDRRFAPRAPLTLPLTIRETGRADQRGSVADITHGGFKATRVEADVGDLKHFSITVDGLIESPSIELTARCRWFNPEDRHGLPIAGFEVVEVLSGDFDALVEFALARRAHISSEIFPPLPNSADKSEPTPHSEDAAKTRFLSNVSHELRTPMNSIIGFAEILSAETYGPLNSKQRTYIGHVLTSAHRLLGLIDDILDLALIESGRMELQISLVNIERVLANCVTLVREKALRQGISVDFDSASIRNAFEIEADEVKLKHIVFGLLSNAVKFASEGGRVEVRAELRERDILISVTDTGAGIKPEDQERIFEPFEQVDSSYSRVGQGAGVGLALARKLVDLHGGRIWVKSEGPGRGSTFSFTIPAFRAMDRGTCKG